MLRLDTGILAFCASMHDGRPQLWTPFVMGGKLCATNGHIMVETDGDTDGYTALPDGVAPRAAKWAEILSSEVGDYMPASSVVLPDEITCEACGGDGHDHDDGTTKGCWYCDGYGVMPFARVTVAGVWFDARYLRLIASLPDAEFAVGTDVTPAQFRYSGGRGALMPMLLAAEAAKEQ